MAWGAIRFWVGAGEMGGDAEEIAAGEDHHEEDDGDGEGVGDVGEDGFRARCSSDDGSPKRAMEDCGDMRPGMETRGRGRGGCRGGC